MWRRLERSDNCLFVSGVDDFWRAPSSNSKSRCKIWVRARVGLCPVCCFLFCLFILFNVLCCFSFDLWLFFFSFFVFVSCCCFTCSLILNRFNYSFEKDKKNTHNTKMCSFFFKFLLFFNSLLLVLDTFCLSFRLLPFLFLKEHCKYLNHLLLFSLFYPLFFFWSLTNPCLRALHLPTHHSQNLKPRQTQHKHHNCWIHWCLQQKHRQRKRQRAIRRCVGCAHRRRRVRRCARCSTPCRRRLTTSAVRFRALRTLRRRWAHAHFVCSTRTLTLTLRLTWIARRSTPRSIARSLTPLSIARELLLKAIASNSTLKSIDLEPIGIRTSIGREAVLRSIKLESTVLETILTLIETMRGITVGVNVLQNLINLLV